MKRHIVMLSAAILLTGTLAACTGTSKTECWRPNNTKASKDCDSGGSGVSIRNSSTKDKTSKRTKAKEEIASPNPDQNIPDQDNPPVNDGDAGQNIPDQDNDEPATNQSNSNDVSGFDPLTDGLYGPGT